MSKVAMIGCGKLGLECAEVMAQNHDVIGYDINPVVPKNFPIANVITDAIKDRDIIFIAAPTPHHPDYDGSYPTSHLEAKDFDYSIVSNILKEVNQHVTTKQIIVLISTVLPGTVRKKLAPLISNARFIYNPYLIAMGSIKWDMINPEMIIIGTETGDKTGTASELIQFYKTLVLKDIRYEIGTWEEAESIKIFYNTFISAKIGLVNMIQDVAQKLGNINVDIVTNALAKSNQRITSEKYMTAGMADGGACHPRDNIALRWLSKELSLGYDLFDTIMLAREKQAENMANFLLQYNLPVVIIGKTYKPNVSYVDGSPSILVGSFIKGKQDLFYYDTETEDYPPHDLGAAVYLLGHNYDVTYYKQKTSSKKKQHHFNPKEGSIIVDPWRKSTEKDFKNKVTIIHYGNTRNNYTR